MRKILAMVLVLGMGSIALADEGALIAAKGWLGALREKNAGKLKAVTRFPFTEAGIGPGSRPCGKKAKAASEKEFDTAADCMISDASFVEVIPSDPQTKTVSLGNLNTPTFKKNMGSLKPLAKDHTFVMTTITGDGLTYEVLLAINKQAVSLVLVESVAQ